MPRAQMPRECLNAKGANAKGANAKGTNAKRDCLLEKGKDKNPNTNLPLVSSSKEIEISVKSGGSSLTALNKTEDFG